MSQAGSYGFLVVTVLVVVATLLFAAHGAGGGSGGGGGGGGGGEGDNSDSLNLTRPNTATLAWTSLNADYTLAGASQLVLADPVGSGGVPTLTLRWAAGSSGGSGTAWTTLWDSVHGVSSSAGVTATTETETLAAQDSATAATLLLDSEGGSPHALFVRGRWFFVGAAPWLNLAWSPLCRALPLSAAITDADAAATFWLPVVSADAPMSVLVSPSGAWSLSFATTGDLQIVNTSTGTAAWSARNATSSVATGCS